MTAIKGETKEEGIMEILCQIQNKDKFYKMFQQERSQSKGEKRKGAQKKTHRMRTRLIFGMHRAATPVGKGTCKTEVSGPTGVVTKMKGPSTLDDPPPNRSMVSALVGELESLEPQKHGGVPNEEYFDGSEPESPGESCGHEEEAQWDHEGHVQESWLVWRSMMGFVES